MDSVMELDSNEPTTIQHQQPHQQPQRRRKPLPLHRCRFPDWNPSHIAALSITPPTFDTKLLRFGGSSQERGILAVGRANGDVELMCWGGHQGWVSWRRTFIAGRDSAKSQRGRELTCRLLSLLRQTLPSSFPIPQQRNSKKPTSLVSHLLFTHQTTLSDSDLLLYDGDLAGAEREISRLEREGVRLFGVGGVGSELVEWEWGGPGARKEVGRVKSTLPTLPPIFALAASRASSFIAIGCEDSTIRILNILDDELELISKIEVGGPGKVRALSLAWGPPVAHAPSTKGKARGSSSSPFLSSPARTHNADLLSAEDSPETSSLPEYFSTPTESYLIAGCSNSSIRRFDVPNSGSLAGVWRSVHRMTVDQLKGEQTVIWAVVVLKDGTLVSGDSMGNIKFWDSSMGTQLQSFKTHKADVLCIAIGSDGTSIFTSGVDQKTSEFRLVSVSSNQSHSTTVAARWIPSSGRRLHSHDVRAMVVSPPYLLPLPSPSPYAQKFSSSLEVPILTSGGLDLSLIIVCVSPSPSSSRNPILSNPVSDAASTSFETTIHRRAAFVPQRSRPFTVSKDARLLVCRRERSIAIWEVDEAGKNSSSVGAGEGNAKIGWTKFRERFGKQDQEEEEEAGNGEEGWKKAIEMDLKLQTNLIASAVSRDGKWLAVSDLYETKLFRLQNKKGELCPYRQKTFSISLSNALPPSLGTGSSSLLFSSDSRRLILATSFGSSIAVVELPETREEIFTVLKVFTEHSYRTGPREIRGNSKINGHVANGDGLSNGNGIHEDEDEDEDEEMSEPAADVVKVGDKPATMSCLALSNDGKWLASADLERKVCVFDLTTLKHHTTLPTPCAVPSALTFLPYSPTLEPTLLLALPSNALSLFGLTSLRFHPWALPLSSLASNTMMDIREPVLGVAFEPREENQVALSKVHESRRATVWNDQTAVVWGANWVSKIDLAEVRSGLAGAAGVPGKRAPVRREMDKKRARETEEEFGSAAVVASVTAAPKLEIRTTRRYQPLVSFDFIGQGEIVAVEKLWFDLARDLPPAWVRSGEFGS